MDSLTIHVRRNRLFVAQLLLVVVLLLLTLLGVRSQPVIIPLLAALVGLWLVGAIVAPFSLLLSTLALAGTTSTLSLLTVSGIPFSANGLLVGVLGAASGLAVLVHFRQQFAGWLEVRRWLVDGAPFIFVLLWAIVRTPGTPTLTNAVTDLSIWASVALVYTLARAYWIAHPERIADGENAFLYVALLPLAAILVDAALGNVHFNNTSPTISLGIRTTLGVRSVPSLFALLMIPLLVRLRNATQPSPLERWSRILLAVILTVWVYFSLSRLVLIALLGIIFPLALLRPRTLLRAGLLTAVGIAVSIVVIQSPLYPRPTFVPVSSVVSLTDEDDGTASGTAARRVQINRAVLSLLSFGRSGVWEELVDSALEENPLLGRGTGVSREYVKVAIPSWDNPHNDYLRVLFDLGAIGLIIFVGGWVAKLRQLWQTWTAFQPVSTIGLRNFMALIAVGYLLLSFFTDNFLVYFFIMGPFALLVAMADAEVMQRQQSHQAERAFERDGLFQHSLRSPMK